jgi:predicted alpha/beta-hydrolase family hydrolase
VTAIKYPAAKADHANVTLILGHGAGAGQTSGFMTKFATGLATRAKKAGSGQEVGSRGTAQFEK